MSFKTTEKLIPFEESEEALAILADGKALAVRFVFDDDGPYKDYKDYYYDILGYEQGQELYLATILSEIGNMPEHYVVVGNGKIVSGLHGDLFYIDTEELKDLEDIIG